MAKCPICATESKVTDFDTSLEIRIDFCSKCNTHFYESGLMFTAPTVLSNSIREKLGIERSTPLEGIINYDQINAELTYANQMRLYWIERFLNLKPSDKFLDIGCGYGNLPILFSSKYNLDLAAGIDLEPKYVELSKNKLRKLIDARIQFECASIYDLPFEDGHFTKLLCAEALEHLSKPLEALKEMKRVCSECLVIQIPCPNPLLFEVFGQFIERVMGKKIYHTNPQKWTIQGQEYFPHHVFEPSSFVMTEYIRQAGLEINQFVGTRMIPIPLSKVNNIFLRNFAENFMHFFDFKLSKIFPFKMLGNQMIVKLIRKPNKSSVK